MDILIVTQYFPPERGAVRRLYEFARFFAGQGHKVSVMTAIPNYPDGIVPPEYRGKFFCEEEMEGVRVYRNWVLPASNNKPGRRMIGFVTFLISSLLNSFRLKSRYDLVLASTPPVTSPVIGWLLSKLKRGKFVIEVRDLQPESSEDFGNLKQSLFTRLIRKIIHSLYRKADRIVSVTDGISGYLADIGVAPERIATVKSGVSDEFINSNSNGIRKKFGWGDKFLVLYSGTLGWVRPLETVVEAARQLADQPDIHFVFVGDGQKKTALENMVRDYGLKNVSFTGLQPLEDIPYFLKAGDVLIESLKEVPVAKMAFPSKMYEYMASGRPIIFGARQGEALKELEIAGGALAYPSDSPEKLAELIMKLRTGQIDGKKLGERYNRHVAEHHTREKWARKYLDFIENI
ncbi:MAG: glycosyltransferase family 4 protein [candidate division Zixibacteria bacterium]|nr:glycosyltransferase family 4 protein [candidate division Zixibacteria bacterium]